MTEKRRALVEKVDAVADSPSERATRIWKHLQKLNPPANQWDIICFCAETLGYLSAGEPMFEKPAKEINTLVYAAHYEHGKFTEHDTNNSARRVVPPSGKTQE